MSTRSLATIRAEAKALIDKKVSSKATLASALPLLIELSDAIKAAKHNYDLSREALDDLNDACADYALEHASVFDEDVKTSAKGVKTGDITLDGTVYHLASGYGTPARMDGDPLSQGFLAELPQNWTKASLKIDTTGINRLGVTEEELEAKGLFRPAKNTWSASEDVA